MIVFTGESMNHPFIHFFFQKHWFIEELEIDCLYDWALFMNHLLNSFVQKNYIDGP